MAPSSQNNTFADIPIPPSELGCQTLFLLILNLANQAVLNKSVKYLSNSREVFDRMSNFVPYKSF